MNRFVKLAILLPAAFALAQQEPSAPASYRGCVMVTEAGDYTFCEPANCSVLTGKLVGPKLAGHTVTLHGTVQAASNGKPRIITITSIVSIGGVCAESCSPTPPRHRGLGGHDRPGSEGGTPGATAPVVPPE